MNSRHAWCDGHLDLAHLAMCGRDLTAPLPATGGPQPATVTLPALADGGVAWAFGTIFLGAGYDGVGGYEHGDQDSARTVALEQIEIYHRLEADGQIRIVRTSDDLDDGGVPLRVVLMMEGADAIRDPTDVAWWYERAVRIVGLAWMFGSRFAGGNARPGGLSREGRELISALDDLGVVHDLSHLSDASASELLESSGGPVIASHSNVRELIDETNQRHLSDELIVRIADRDGVIGLNLLFGIDVHLRRTGTIEGSYERPAIASLVDHADRMAELAGRRHVALGSDMDGGFGADRLPAGIDRPADLHQIADELAARGWSSDEIDGVASGNWLRLLRSVLG